MTTEQKIYREVLAVKEMVKTLPIPKEWISAEEACELLGIGKEMLRKLRYRGKITNLLVRESGRGFKYNRKEIESLLIPSKP